jgi:hypothetical protein
MKKITLFALLSLIVAYASAQTEPEEYVKVFLSEVGKANFESALELMPLSDKMKEDTAYIHKLLTRLEKNADELGKYYGYELISKEEISPSLINYSYFIKYQSSPQRILFVFYKPAEKWQLNRISVTGGTSQRTPNRQQRFRF